MWKYIRKFLPFAVIAALCMVGEVLMDLIQPQLMSRIIDEGVLGLYNNSVSDLDLIISLGLRMIILVLFGGFCGSMNNVFSHMAAQNIGNEMRKDAFRHIMRFSFPQTDKYGTGSLVVRVTNDVTQVQNFVSLFFRGLIRTSFLMFGSIFCMYRLNPDFGRIILCLFPFLIGFLILCLLKVNPLFERLQRQLDELNAIMQEDVSGIRIIKACVRETSEKLRFGKANADLVKTQLKTLFIFAFMNPVVNALMYFGIALILLTGASDAAAGTTTPGTIMAAITYTTTLLNGIVGVVMIFQNFSRGIVSWGRIRELLDEEPQMPDGSFEVPGSSADQGLAAGPPQEPAHAGAEKAAGQTAAAPADRRCDTMPADAAPAVEFRDVSFTYPGSRRAVLQHITLSIRPGETIAVMGVTGCGKTSLISLIPRFYDAAEGTVLVNGINVCDYKKQDLRELVSVVLQKSEIFSASVRENISWGNPDASMEQIRAAARAAQAESFILDLEDGYDTQIAERGMSLSGGQKQRLSIARAILKGAPVMIFDDATSALDLKTEADLYQALDEAYPEVTKIIVAQRIASVRRADRIVVLENRQITAVGSHDELMAVCPAYQEICRSQFGDGQNERKWPEREVYHG